MTDTTSYTVQDAYDKAGGGHYAQAIRILCHIITGLQANDGHALESPAAPQVAGGLAEVVERVRMRECVLDGPHAEDCRALCDAVESIPELERQLTAARNCHRIVEEQKARLSKAAHSAREAERDQRDKLERALEEETNTRVAHGVAIGQNERLTRELDKLRKDVAAEIEAAVESRSMSDNEGRTMLALVKAPTPAAPCGTDDVRQLLADIRDTPEDNEWHGVELLCGYRKRAADLLAALAETKAVES